MARTARVSLKFLKFPVIDKVSLGELVHGKMQSSGYFPSPPVDYADMEQTNRALHDAVQHAKSGGTENYRKQDAAEKNWDDMMLAQARYVSMVAHGDKGKIVAAGLPVTVTEPERWGKPQMLSRPQVFFNNRKGGIDIQVEKTKYAIAYNYLLVTEPERVKLEDGSIIIAQGTTPVYQICDTHRKINVQHLPGGMSFYLFVFPVGPAGVGHSPEPLAIVFPHPLVGK